MQYKGKIVHFVTDEKFIDFVITNFNKIDPDKHIYLLGKEINQNLRYIKNPEHIIFFKKNLLSFIKIYFKLINAECVVFHNLFEISRVIHLLFPLLPKKVWCAWGGDFYMLKEIESKLLTPVTQAYLDTVIKNEPFAFNIIHVKNSFSRKIKTWKYNLKLKLRSVAVQRINYFAPVIYDEFLLFNKLISSKPKFLFFSYGTVKPIEEEKKLIPKQKKTVHILLGNSASYTNNHLEVLPLLAKFKDEDIRIIIPLSYGGNNEYINYVENTYKNIFKDKILALKEFLPLTDYTNLLQSVDIAILPHLRQQAFGNIVQLLNAGAKLFFYKSNLLYNYFHREEIEVHDINHINNLSFHDFISSSDNIISRNKNRIMSLYSQQAVSTYFKAFHETCLRK